MTIGSGTKLGSVRGRLPHRCGRRAKDAKIGRDVAIKVLPASLVTDAERLQRFEQEATKLQS